MKGKIKEGLEKLIKAGKNIGRAIKKNGKIGIVLLGIGIGGANAKADTCKIYCSSVGANSPTVVVKHCDGAAEGHDGIDAPFNQSPASPRIDFYSKVPLSPPYEDKLGIDARGPNSTTYFDIKIEGAEIPDSNSILAELSFQILDGAHQGNFLWKNLIAELYNPRDVNDCNNLIARYDIKDLAGYGQKIPLTISNGLSYQLLIKPFNYADLNRDRRVDFKDYAIWANNLGRTNTVPRDANDLGVFSDINRDKIVDMNDLGYFIPEWLWNADPNAYSKLTPKVNGVNVFDGESLKAFRRDVAKRCYGKRELLYGKKENEVA